MTKDKDSGQLKLRLPDDLKASLKAEAETNNRSLNGEIVNRLRSTFTAKRAVNGHLTSASCQDTVRTTLKGQS